MIDTEIARILHEQETRAHSLLLKHRTALDAVAEALLDRETIDGAEVAQLVQASLGEPSTTTESVSAD